MAELVDALDSKSSAVKACRFESDLGHQNMGRLTTYYEFKDNKLDPLLFGAYSYSYPGEHFSQPNHKTWQDEVLAAHPFRVSIHIDLLQNTVGSTPKGLGQFWADVRRWVERYAEGDCYIIHEDMSYKWYWGKGNPNEYDGKMSTVKHSYWHFNFEVDSDATAFSLIHSDKVVSVVSELPGQPKMRELW